MVILYEHPTLSYVQKTKIALREKGIEVEVKPPGMSDGRFGGDEFLEANPLLLTGSSV